MMKLFVVATTLALLFSSVYGAPFEETLAGYIPDYWVVYPEAAQLVPPASGHTVSSCATLCDDSGEPCVGFSLSSSSVCTQYTSMGSRLFDYNDNKFFLKMAGSDYTMRFQYIIRTFPSFFPRGESDTNVYTEANPKSCADKCEATPTCVGFTFHNMRHFCFIVYDSFASSNTVGTSAPTSDDPVSSTYYKPTALLNLNYEPYIPNMMSAGAVVAQSNKPIALKDCAAWCDTTYKCLVFEYSITTNLCVLKDAYIPVPSPGTRLYITMTVSYMSQSLLAKTSLPFVAELNTDYDGYDLILETFSFAGCMAACQKANTCAGFVYRTLGNICLKKTAMVASSRKTLPYSIVYHKSQVCNYKNGNFLNFYPFAGSNLLACATQCDTQESCTGFGYGPDNVCLLHPSDNQNTLAYRTYVKQKDYNCYTKA